MGGPGAGQGPKQPPPPPPPPESPSNGLMGTLVRTHCKVFIRSHLPSPSFKPHSALGIHPCHGLWGDEDASRADGNKYVWVHFSVLPGGHGCQYYVGRHVLERPYTVGPPPPPLDPPPALPMFEADGQNFASTPLAPGGFKLKSFGPAFGGDHRGTQGGGVSQPPPPPPLSEPPFPPSNTSLHVGSGNKCACSTHAVRT